MEKWQAAAEGPAERSCSRSGAFSAMTHHDVVVPVYVAILALTLVVVMALGSQRPFRAAPAVVTSQISYIETTCKYHRKYRTVVHSIIHWFTYS